MTHKHTMSDAFASAPRERNYGRAVLSNLATESGADSIRIVEAFEAEGLKPSANRRMSAGYERGYRAAAEREQGDA